MNVKYDGDCPYLLMTQLLLACCERFACLTKEVLMWMQLYPLYPGLPHVIFEAVDEYTPLLLGLSMTSALLIYREQKLNNLTLVLFK